MIAAIFEAELTAEQAERLAGLMREGRSSRPKDVITASLIYEDGRARLTAYWNERAAFEAYLATGAVPRGTELMRRVGAEPEMRVVEVLDLG